jgi:hypothetical protein
MPAATMSLRNLPAALRAAAIACATAVDDDGVASFPDDAACYVKLLAAVRTALHRSRGVGDTIASATKAVGIKPCVGCTKRQAWLNEQLPYRQGS